MANADLPLRHWLAKTWNPVIYLKSRFLYAIGNTPMENVLSQLQVEDDENILLVGAGDIRHILKTVAGLGSRPEHAGKPKTLTFHLNDVDPVIVARDVVLFQIVCDMDPDNKDDLSFLWCVWYNMELSDSHYARLMDTLDKLCVVSHQFLWKFGSFSTGEECCKLWKSWKEEPFDTAEFRRSRLQNLIYLLGGGMSCDAELDAWAFEQFLKRVPHIAREVEATELMSWFLHGTTVPPFLKVKGDSGHFINPTLVRPGVTEWCLHHLACPFDAYSTYMGDPREGDNFADECAHVLKKMIMEVKQQMKSTQVQVVFLLGDCLEVCLTSLAEDGPQMNIIHTSNLADYLGPLPLLLCCAPLLKNGSVLITGTMRWRMTEKTMQEYLDLHIGLRNIEFLPTIFGVHLAEDFELGTCQPPVCLEFSAKEQNIHWVKAKPSEVRSTLKDSPELEAAVSFFVDRCFKKETNSDISAGLTGIDLMTPLIALFLLNRISATTDGNKGLLVTATDKLRSMVNYNNTFGATLRAMAASLGCTQISGSPDLQGNAFLVCVEVPLIYDFSRTLLGDAVRFSSLAYVALFSNSHPRPSHLFANYKFNADTQTVEILMLKSDWEALPPNTLCAMILEVSPSMSKPLPIKDVASVKYSWKVTSAEEKQVSSQSEDVTIGKMTETTDCFLVRVDVKNHNTEMEVKPSTATKDRCNRIHLEIDCAKWHTQKCIDVGFSCNVDAAKTRTQVSREQGFIHITVPKHPLWNRGIYLLPRYTLQPSSLSSVSHAVLESYLFEPRNLVGRMFSGPNGPMKYDKLAAEKSLLFNLQEDLQTLWVEYHKNFPVVKSYGIYQMKPHGADLQGNELLDIEIFINGCYIFNDVPLMHLTFIDKEVISPVIESGPLLFAELQQVRAQKHKCSLIQADSVHQYIFSHKLLSMDARDLEQLKKLLRYNSHLTQQPPADVQPAWMIDSFIQLHFPRYSLLRVLLVESGLKLKVRGTSEPVGSWSSSKSGGDESSSCAVCRQRIRLYSCSRCKTIYYCSKHCQKINWKEHKKTCRTAPATKLKPS